MKVEYELNKQDYIDFNIYHSKNSDAIKKSLFVQRYFIPIIFLIIPFFITKAIDIPLWYWISIFSLTAVLWVVFYPKHFVSSITKMASKMVNEGKNKDLLGKHIVTVDEQGLIDKSENGENKIYWSGVERIASTEKHFFIYVSSISACIVPKNSFKNEGEKVVFFQFVNGMIEGSSIQ